MSQIKRKGKAKVHEAKVELVKTEPVKELKAEVEDDKGTKYLVKGKVEGSALSPERLVLTVVYTIKKKGEDKGIAYSDIIVLNRDEWNVEKFKKKALEVARLRAYGLFDWEKLASGSVEFEGEV